jgi:hypothetical protein
LNPNYTSPDTYQNSQNTTNNLTGDNLNSNFIEFPCKVTGLNIRPDSPRIACNLYYGSPDNDYEARIELTGFDETLTDLFQIWFYPILHISLLKNARLRIKIDRFRQKNLGDKWIQEVPIIFFFFFLTF